MKQSFPNPPGSLVRVFTACLLSFSIFIVPFTQVAAAGLNRAPAPAKSEAKHSSKVVPSGESLFVNPPAMPAVTTVTATKVDSFLVAADDADSDGKADPGDKITYTVNISDSGADATGVTFNDTVHAHTTLVPGSFNISPLANNDSYDTIANTLLEVGPVGSPSSRPKVTVTGSVFDNDTEFMGDSFTLKSLQAVNFISGTVTATSTNGGTIVMDGTGKFSFTPKDGSTVADTFTYTITDDGPDNIAGNADDLTNTATVTINVTAPRIWYVDNTVGVTGLGRSSDPFKTLAEAQAKATAVGDYVYVFTGSGNTGQNAGFTFQANNQQLLGEGVALSIPVSVNGGPNPTLLRNAGTKPSIGNSGGNGVTVGNLSGIIIRGLTIAGSTNGIGVTFSAAGRGVTINTNTLSGTSANGLDVTTSGVGGGSATIASNTISSAGAEGIDINGQGTGGLILALDSETVTSTGSGIDINGTTGGVTLTSFAGNAISGASGANGVLIQTATFDSNPGVGGLQALTAGSLNIGASGVGNGVGGNGLVMFGTLTGTLPFTTLNIFSDNGRGIDVTGSGVATTGLTASSGATISATNGAAVWFTSGTTIDLQSALITSTNSPDNGVNLSSVNGTFSAVNTSSISNATGDDFFVGGTGTANITWNASLNNSGAGNSVEVSGHTGGTVAFTGAITDTGQGINLNSNAGTTLNFSGGITLNGTAAVFTATGGAAAVNVTGTNTIGSTTAPTATALNVANSTIGASGLTFRSISCNGATTGIILNNTGVTGGLTVTGNGSAGTGGTIQNISARGASFISARGISLNWMNFTSANTSNGAASDGTVGGNENTDENGAIHLSAAVNVSLSNITISGTTVQHGINGNTVTNLDLTNVNISNTGDAVWESGIYLFHLKGLASASQDSVWDNVDITDTAQFNVSIINASGTNAAGGEKDKLTIQNGSSFKNSGKNVIGDHISIFNSVTANFQVVVNGATFDSKINGEYVGAHTSDGIQVDVSGSSARYDATITGCTFTSTTGGGAGQSAINLSSTTGAGTFSVTNNTATVRQGAGINIAVTGPASLTGQITGNTLATNITNNPSFGINMVEEGNGSIVANVENNTIQGTGSGIGTTTAFDYGIRGGARAGSGNAHLTLKGNTVQTAKAAGTWLFAGNNTGGETNRTCVNFSTAVKNSIHADNASKFADYFLEQYTGTTFNIQGLTGSGTNSANVESFVASTDAVAGRLVTAGAGTIVNYTNATCTAAPLLLAEGGIESAMFNRCTNGSVPSIDAQPFGFDESFLSRFFGLSSTSNASHALSTTLDQSELNTIVKAARDRWLRTGLSSQQSAVVDGLTFEVRDLSDGYLGEADGDRIFVDRDAQGKGWFVDVTPQDDSEFSKVSSSTRRYADPTSLPAGHVDLLTAIEHEIGHKLGLNDSYAQKDRNGLMYGYLTVGERRLPAKGQAAGVRPSTPASTHFLSLRSDEGSSVPVTKSVDVMPFVAVGEAASEARGQKSEVRSQRSEVRSQRSDVRLNHAKSRRSPRTNTAAASHALAPMPSGDVLPTANIGTLKVGQSVTIRFQVTLDTPPNLDAADLVGGPHVRNQGTVSGSNFSNVLTDDTAVGGASDPTDTPVDLFDTSTNLVSNSNPAVNGEQVTFTATVSETPAVGSVDPTGSVDFIDTSNANAVICNDVPLSAGSAQCQISSLTVGTHNIQAVYSGDGNFQTSTSNTVAEVINACTPNPVVTKIADTNDGVCDVDCSLREAIAVACAGNTITFNTAGVFATPQTITLGSELTLARNLTIDGPDAAANHVTISGGAGIRAFTIQPGKTDTIRDLTISGASGVASGGGINNDHGTLTLINMTISGNTAGIGGGVYNNGIGPSGTASLTIINSTLSGNTANTDGGAVNNAGTGAGGSATLIVNNSTMSGNNALNNGGGISSDGSSGAAVMTTTNATISNNHADSDDSAGGDGGGLALFTGTYRLRNTIVAGNFKGTSSPIADDVFGSVDTSAGSSNNLIGTGGAGGLTNGTNFNQVGVANPGMGPLANNGGPTLTHALLFNSLAIEAGDNTIASGAGLTTDQRGTGFPRIADSADANTTATVDIGAFELHPSIEDIPDKNTPEDTLLSFSFNLGDGTGALITSVTASSDNTTLVPNDVGHLSVTGSGSTRTLNITPATNANTAANGTATITVTVTATNGRTAQDTFVLTVDAINDPPSFVKGADQVVDEDAGPQTVNGWATSISPGPADESGQTLTFNVSVTGTTGSLTFSSAPAIDATTGNLTYTTTGDTNGVANISVTLSDNGSNVPPNSNTSAAQTFTITVNSINDPPSFVKGADQNINESAGPQTVNGWATSISQGPNETGQTLTFNTSVTGTTGNLTFATPPAIDATTGTLTYEVTNSTNGTADVSVTLSDDGSNTPPNSNTSAAQTFTITVGAFNDPPVNTVPGPLSIPQDTVLTFNGANKISVADADAAEAPSDGVITVSLTATNGTLNLSGTTGLTFNSGADGTAAMSFDGTIPDINTALDGMTFTPTNNFTGAASVQIVSDDQGKTGPGGPKTDTDTVNITVTPLVSMYINEVAFDPDSSGNNEYIEFRGTPNSTIPAGTYFVAVDGTGGNTGDVTTTINLSGLSFGSNGFLVLLQQGNTYTTAAGASVVTSTTTGFGGLPGAIFQADGGATDLENDAVTFMLIQTGTAPSLTDDIDSNDDGTPDGSVFSGWSIRDSIGNVDGDPNGHGYGALNYSTTGSGTSIGNVVTVGFTLTYVGRRGDTTGSAAADWVASCALGGAAPNFTLDDSGSEVEPPNFAGKALDHIGSTNFLNVAPVNTVPGAQATGEDVPLVFTGATQISIADSDANGAEVKVTLTAVNGTISLSGTTGLTFTPPSGSNDGTNDTQMIFTGTVTDINTALDNLTFTPTSNYFGSASLTILTDDQGNTGTDGAKTDSDAINITVSSVNDAPSFTKGADQIVDEDAGAQTVNGWATNISAGPPDESGQTLTFNVSPAGTTGNIAFTSGPAINSSTGNLTYTTAANTNGTATFDVTLSDNGGGTNTSPTQQFTITVNAVNDAPSFQIASNPPAVNEDAGAQTVNSFATNFQPGPVTATDEAGQTLVGYTLTQTGSTGSLTFTGGPSINAAGTLTYTSTANTNGTATFNAVATDSGSGTPPNVNQSAAVSFTITVNPVADTPLVTNATTTTNHQTTSGLVITAADVETTYFKITNITNGTLYQNDGTTQINNGDFITVADGGAGLKFTPGLNLSNPTPFHFDVQASLNNTNAGLGGGIATATISVTPSLNLTVNTLGDAPDATLNGTCDTDLGTPGDQCTLRAAIQETNNAVTDDAITFALPASSTISLLSELPAIDGNLTITGPGANLLTVERSNSALTNFRIFKINPSRTVSISGLTITKGRAINGAPNDSGGGILNDHGTLTISNSSISGNTAVSGSGVYSNGIGVGGTATLTIINSTISGNTGGDKGGIRLEGVSGTPTATITNTTISGNTVSGSGAGMGIADTNTTLTNVTVTNNQADSGNDGSGAFGGIYIASGTVTLKNTIVAGNFKGISVADDIFGTVDPSSSFNLIGTGGSGGLINGVNNNQVDVADAHLGPLANNGGPTQTHALLAFSTAIDAGNNTFVVNPPFNGPPFTDQRGTGFARINDGPDSNSTATVDIGAFESATATNNPPLAVNDNYATNEETPLSVPAPGVLANDIDVDALTAVLVSGPTHASAFGLNANGSFNYTPALNFFGTDTFTYKANDGATDGNTATVTITVSNVNDAPTITNNTGITVNEGSTGNIISSTKLKVSDVDNTDAQLTYTVGTAPTRGTLKKSGAPVLSGGTFTQSDINNNFITYDHDGSETTSDVFSFTVADGAGGSIGSTNFNITVTPVNDAPTIAAVGVTRTAGTAVSNSTIANVNDAEDAKNTLVVTVNNSSSATVNGVTVSNLSVSAAGVVTANVVAACGATTANFTLKVTDSGALNAMATLTVTVNANTAPTLTYNTPQTVGFGGSLTINPATGPSDNGSISSIVLQSQGTYAGTISVNNSTGAVSISNATPAGTHSITIRATDNCGTTTDASFSLVVSAPPTISIDDVSLTEGDSGTKTATFTVTLSAASTVTATVNYQTANGTATAGSDYQAANGTVTFTPGQVTQPISVTINGDQSFEPDETFFVNLSGATNSTIADNQGLGTIINDDAAGGIFRFSAGSYTVGESDGSIVITVQRTGDLTLAATVDYASTDDSDPAHMASCGAVTGNASSRCDFTTAIGTLRFAAGENSKTFPVLINQDSYVEGPESLSLTLSNPTNGAVMGVPGTAILQITDDATEPPTNAIDDTGDFVRQHYLDFLDREKDTSGFNSWVNLLNSCAPGNTSCDRVAVSGSFFGSPEFQSKGYFATRFYFASFGRDPLFVEMMRDLSRLNGATPAESIAAKANFPAEFTQRAEFHAAYDSLSNTQYVDTLIANTGVAYSNRNQMITDLNTSAKTRAQVLNDIVEATQFVQNAATFNRAYVLTEYWGYLRRNPDTPGLNNWIIYLNAHPGDFRTMVNGFVNSIEYRKRFGTP